MCVTRRCTCGSVFVCVYCGVVGAHVDTRVKEWRNRRRQLELRGGGRHYVCRVRLCLCFGVCLFVRVRVCWWSLMQWEQQYSMHDTDSGIYALHKTDGDRGSLCFPLFPLCGSLCLSTPTQFSRSLTLSTSPSAACLLCFVIFWQLSCNGIVKVKSPYHPWPLSLCRLVEGGKRVYPEELTLSRKVTVLSTFYVLQEWDDWERPLGETVYSHMSILSILFKVFLWNYFFKITINKVFFK